MGQVVNWGFGPQRDIGVELKTGSWRASALSASDGNYGFGGLGVGIGMLHVAVPPGQAKQLQSLVQNAGVYLNCNYPTVANIAVFSGPRVDPPATIDMSAPSQTVAPDSNFDINLTIENSLPTEITNVIVTNLMPPGFTALQVSTSVDFKDAQIINAGEDGQMVVVNLDKMTAGAKATIRIIVNAYIDLLSGTQIRNTATLFYRESAADQTWLDFTVGSDELPLPAASASAGGGADFIPPGEAPTGGNSTSPVKEAATGDDVVPPGNMPSTGAELTLSADTFSLGEAVPLSGATLTLSSDNLVSPDSNGDASLQSPNLTTSASDSELAKVTVVHNATSSRSSITVAMAVLFLGMLVLGSGITFWRCRLDSLDQDKE
jgi:hypothetical protein